MNRRAFIKKAALLGAAAVVVPKVLFAAEQEGLKPVRWLDGKPFNGVFNRYDEEHKKRAKALYRSLLKTREIHAKRVLNYASTESY